MYALHMVQHAGGSPQSWRVVQPRGELIWTRRCLQEGALTIGFLGGSITDPRSRSNWPEPLLAWFVEHFPAVRFTVENAAIGATGSGLATFRARRDILERGCNLVFVEYAVNDNGLPTDERMRTREGLLRQLLTDGQRDVILVYTFCQEMYSDMLAHRLPASIAEFEQLAEHYQLPSVWMGLHAFQEVQAGRMRWEEWLPDGLHPHTRGSLSYAESVIDSIQQALSPLEEDRALLKGPERAMLTNTQDSGPTLPPPLHPLCWEHVALLSFDRVKTIGPWSIRRFSDYAWIEQTLSTSAVGAQLTFACTARGLALAFDFGKASAAFRYQLDGGPWRPVNRERPAWMGDRGVFWLTLIFEQDVASDHQIVLEVLHGNASNDHPDCSGTNFDLALIGLINA